MNLERALVELARELDVPDSPDLVPGVLTLLDRPQRKRAMRRVAMAIALAVLAAIAATLAVPEARSALFRVLHIGGERIVLVDELPEDVPGPVDFDLALGEVVTLEEARRRAGFDLRELAAVGEPDRVYQSPSRTVWFLWGTPRRVRLLLAQSPALGIGSPPVLEKLVGMGTEVEPLSVHGRRAFFLSGEPHVVYLLDEQGAVVQEAVWLAQNVLVWEQHGITFRIEGALDGDHAVELAESLR